MEIGLLRDARLAHTMTITRRRPEQGTLYLVVRNNLQTLYAAVENGFASPLHAAQRGLRRRRVTRPRPIRSATDHCRVELELPSLHEHPPLF